MFFGNTETGESGSVGRLVHTNVPVHRQNGRPSPPVRCRPVPAVVLPTGSLGVSGRARERPLTLSSPMCRLIEMQVYAFTSAFDLTIRAFTRDPTGNNLPVEHAPWRHDGRGHSLTMKLPRFRGVFDSYIDCGSVVTASIMASYAIGDR